MAPSIPVEKLVIAVVQSDDANAVQSALVDAGCRVTRIDTAGGFLRRGNVTLLAGVPAGDVDTVIKIVRANVRSRVTDGQSKTPVATMLFVVPVSEFARI